MWRRLPPECACPVALKETGASAPAVAVTVLVPRFGPRVKNTCASPLAPVEGAAGLLTVPPPTRRRKKVHVDSGEWVVILVGGPTTKGLASATPVMPNWLFPETIVSAASGPGFAVTENVTEGTPVTLTTMLRARHRAESRGHLSLPVRAGVDQVAAQIGIGQGTRRESHRDVFQIVVVDVLNQNHKGIGHRRGHRGALIVSADNGQLGRRSRIDAGDENKVRLLLEVTNAVTLTVCGECKPAPSP